MAKKLLTADQVKEYLGIPDFRHLTKDKLIEFVSAIPDMEKDVAIEVIRQFPEFSNYAKATVDHYEGICNSIIEKNGDSVQAVMEGYKKILDTLSELIKADDLDPAEKRYFAEKMVDVADKMAAFDTSNKKFLAGMAKYTAWFFGGALAIGASILGVKIIGKRIPHLA